MGLLQKGSPTWAKKESRVKCKGTRKITKEINKQNNDEEENSEIRGSCGRDKEGETRKVLLMRRKRHVLKTLKRKCKSPRRVFGMTIVCTK